MSPPHVLPALIPRPLGRVSPSRFRGLKTCILREVAVTTSGTRELLPHYPKARVGSAFHRVCERAARGEFKNDEGLAQAWDEEIGVQEDEMRLRWYEGHLVPLESNTRNYQVIRLQCLARCRRWLREREQASGTGVAIQVEVRLSTAGEEVVGQLDLVRTGPDGVEVVDYKTGIVSESHEGGDPTGSRVKPAYQEQMKLYAALYHANRGVWPGRLVLIGADACEHEIPYSPAEASELLEEAIELRASVNAQVLRGCSLDSLASPSPAACKFCPVRPACPAYWNAHDCDPDWPVDVRGQVVDLRQLGNGSYRVVLDGTESCVIRGLTAGRHPFLQACETAILCNLRQEGNGGSPRRFAETILTTGYDAP